MGSFMQSVIEQCIETFEKDYPELSLFTTWVRHNWEYGDSLMANGLLQLLTKLDELKTH